MRPVPLDRRAFLRAGVASATGVLAATGLADCSPTRHGASPAGATPPTTAQWQALAASLTGHLVRRGARGYDVARLLYNPKFDEQRPTAIAYCASPSDVARTLAFGRAHGIELAARCGGHSYGGYSSGTGRLVIDVSLLKGVRPAAAPGGTATVGAGARLIDLYNVLGSAGQLVPGGSCPTVGVTGLTLGGGVGVLARRYGLACDNLRGVELVTADGVVHHCSPHSDPDLFWASQGGGGGNFGVVTSLQFATHALPELTLFTYDFSFDSATELLGAWQHWNVGLDDVVWSNCQLLSGDGIAFARVSGVACADESTTTSLLAPLLASAPAPTSSFLGGASYIQTMMIEAGCSGLTVAACHLDTVPGGTLSRQAFTASSNYVAAPMSDARLTATVDAVRALSELPELGGGLVFDALGGAVNRPAATDTAFVHRRFLASIQSSFNWTQSTPSASIAAGGRWLADVRRDVYVPGNGAYQNYIDPTLPDWSTAYYGENLARLEQIKDAVDPDAVFHFAQSIPR